jgi:hypothetical protein
MHAYAYSPWHNWPKLASNLAALFDGDPKPLLGMDDTKPPASPLPNATHASSWDPDDRFLNTSNPYPEEYAHGLEAAVSVICGDGDDLTRESKSDYATYVSQLVNQSALIGPTWAQITLPCRHWHSSLHPARRNRFAGPFRSRLRDYDGRASPLLFIGNTADPVTPLSNAKKSSAMHEGSVVLTQNTPGHCSGPNVPSTCTWGVIRRFYNDGELPPSGKVCEVDWKPWDRKVGE